MPKWYASLMSCITLIGSRRHFGPGCNVILPRHSPPWTASKQRRLEDQAMSIDSRLRAIAAYNPRTTGHLLMRLLMDPDVTVRRQAVKNPNLTDHMMHVALADNDMGIVAYVKMIREEVEDA